ncbi:hypothetical protein DPMN_035111 [Dreissena polymorpha]|uniref:Uncharacterized protein n=1 Tax=Dreissena polymorpha TaxID=45954 RepID=A0A9D4M924_DREPO|nr:hypothetical protein DPMN_035111 [Dreissena polymorpha]
MAGKALKPYTDQTLQKLHGDIKQKVGQMQPCKHQCSRQYKAFNRPGSNVGKRGCLSERNGSAQEVFPLLAYYSDHRELVGREWLFDLIEQYVYNDTSHKHGILLEAEMGRKNKTGLDSFSSLVRDSTGCFHVHIAACNDNTELLEYLIMEDIDHSTFTCDNGSTPLHSAIQLWINVATTQCFAQTNDSEENEKDSITTDC